MIARQFAGLIVAGAVIVALLAAPMASLAASADVDYGQEIGCLALTIYHEARGESELGKLAVGHVVMNRTRSALFPASVCAVVWQGGQQLHRCQFSWWCDGRSDRPKDQAALRESLRLADWRSITDARAIRRPAPSGITRRPSNRHGRSRSGRGSGSIDTCSIVATSIDQFKSVRP